MLLCSSVAWRCRNTGLSSFGAAFRACPPLWTGVTQGKDLLFTSPHLYCPAHCQASRGSFRNCCWIASLKGWTWGQCSFLPSWLRWLLMPFLFEIVLRGSSMWFDYILKHPGKVPEAPQNCQESPAEKKSRPPLSGMFQTEAPPLAGSWVPGWAGDKAQSAGSGGRWEGPSRLQLPLRWTLSSQPNLHSLSLSTCGFLDAGADRPCHKQLYSGHLDGDSWRSFFRVTACSFDSEGRSKAFWASLMSVEGQVGFGTSQSSSAALWRGAASGNSHSAQAWGTGARAACFATRWDDRELPAFPSSFPELGNHPHTNPPQPQHMCPGTPLMGTFFQIGIGANPLLSLVLTEHHP